VRLASQAASINAVRSCLCLRVVMPVSCSVYPLLFVSGQNTTKSFNWSKDEKSDIQSKTRTMR
jgi:hypothetical protein